MPHKHKRKRGDDDAAIFDLPPNARATALPASHKPRAVVANDDGEDASQQPKRSNKRRKPSKMGGATDAQQNALLDDTPKQFARLMAFQQQGKKLRKGLDDGVPQPKSKDKKQASKQAGKGGKTTAPDQGKEEERATEDQSATGDQQERQQQLKIQPGERLGDFALRVDQSLPLSAVPKHSTRAPPGERQDKAYLTKHNKRLARLQAAWRSDEERLKEKRAEEKEEAEDQKEEEGLLWMDVDEARKGRKGKKKGKEGDIWKVLERKRREEEREGGAGGGDRKVAGLSAATAVQAPPVLKGVKNMFKEKAPRQQLRGRGVVAT